MRKVRLGSKYTDTLHGTTGVATAITSYLTGCDRVCLEWTKDDGEVDSVWLDVTRLEGVTLPKKDQKPGGPGKVAPSLDPYGR